MNVRTTFLVVVALGIAFWAGTAFQSWRAKEELKKHPCLVTAWNPYSQKPYTLTLDTRDCLKLGPRHRFTGVWVDNPYSASFTSDRPGVLPDNVDLTLYAPERSRLYQLAGLGKEVPQFSGKTFNVTVIGRVGNRGCCWLHAQENTIVVDEVLAADLR